MNPHASHPVSLSALIRSMAQHRQLIFQMIQREVVGRYKGSAIGLGWSFFNPVLMLAVYTFVFSVVFKARWGIDTNDSKTQFAVVLFVEVLLVVVVGSVVVVFATTGSEELAVNGILGNTYFLVSSFSM